MEKNQLKKYCKMGMYKQVPKIDKEIYFNRRPVSSVGERRTTVREVSGSSPRPDQNN